MSNIIISGQTLAQQADAASSQQVAAFIQLMDDQVQLSVSTMSIAQDAATSATAADDLAELGARFNKDIQKAMEGKKDRIDQSKKIQALLEKVPDFPDGENLAKLPDDVRKHLEQKIQERKSQGEKASTEDLLSYLKDQKNISDPTHTYMALKYLESCYADDPSQTENLGLVQDALKQIVKEDRPNILAGVNVTQQAQESAKKTGGFTTDGLRNDYRSVIEKPDQGFVSTFTQIVEKYGSTHFKAGVEFLYQAAGADLSSKNSSIEKSKLIEVRDVMYNALSLNTCLQASTRLLERVEDYKDKITGAPAA